MRISLVVFHKGYHVELFLLRSRVFGWDQDSTEDRTAFQDSNLNFLEYFCDVVLGNEVKGQSFVGVIPRVWDTV